MTVMRTKTEIIEKMFREHFIRMREVLEKAPEDRLYLRPRELPHSFVMFSTGEYLLRSAAAIEQVFLGITRKLWDDPFEWTLPEALNSKVAIAKYFDETFEVMEEGFTFLKSDEDLDKAMPSPEKLRTILEILVDALSRSEHHLGRAVSIAMFFSDEKPVRR
jgi:hypothetical protein